MNDQELIEHLLKWQTENFYSAGQLCETLQINKNTLTNWKQGKPLSPKTRQKIASLVFHRTVENNVERPDEKVKAFPVISEAAAATVNTAYFPACDYAREYADEFVSFSKGKEGDFVIKVSGDSMEPWYPSGTLLLVRSNVCLQCGDRVIAILADGTTLFKIFAEDEDSFYLMSENREEGKDYKFAKNDFNGVRALYLVIQSMRDERAMDTAKRHLGIPSDWHVRMKEVK
jgi:phage repressor protein C with HTH and peptisase S24 domain